MTIDAAIDDIAEAATESPEAYEVAAGNGREVLYGVSGFSAEGDIETLAILERFVGRESYSWHASTRYARPCSPLAPEPITSTYNFWWTLPGAAVVVGSALGEYLAKVIAWDFDVSDDDPIVVLELLPIHPSEVRRLLARRTPAA